METVLALLAFFEGLEGLAALRGFFCAGFGDGSDFVYSLAGAMVGILGDLV